MNSELLKQIIADQKEESYLLDSYVHREIEPKLQKLMNNQEIVVLTGIRRCGKSVLLQHIRGQLNESDYYFNFEDERLINFKAEHFQLLLETFIELYGVQETFFFDEIQNIPNWELFVRRLYNRGAKIYITGSNATLFSDELGSRLTGRYIQVNLYPYSFYEIGNNIDSKSFNSKNPSTTEIGMIKRIFNDYCRYGGFPAYLVYKQNEYLQSLYQSILHRDIVVRYKLGNDINLKKLIFQLASNCGKTITYNALRKTVGLSSATTISNYCHYLEKSFLCFFINKYSFSTKAQLQTPKKVYFIDHVLAKTIGFRISEDRGRMLENMVFLELKRLEHDVFYHKESKECDFVIHEKNRIVQAIQVCANLYDEDTQEREYAGLLEAMIQYNLKKGLIITENESFTEKIVQDNKTYTITIVPFWQWARTPA